MNEKAEEYIMRNIEKGAIVTVDEYVANVYNSAETRTSVIYGIGQLLLPQDRDKSLLVLSNNTKLTNSRNNNNVLYAVIDYSNPLHQYIAAGELTAVMGQHILVVTNMLISAGITKREKYACVFPLAIVVIDDHELEESGEVPWT